MRLLGVYSTDFEVLSQFLLSKSRDQIKRKFKLMEKTHTQQLDQALKSPPAPLDEEMLHRLQVILG